MQLLVDRALDRLKLGLVALAHFAQPKVHRRSHVADRRRHLDPQLTARAGQLRAQRPFGIGQRRPQHLHIAALGRHDLLALQPQPLEVRTLPGQGHKRRQRQNRRNRGSGQAQQQVNHR